MNSHWVKAGGEHSLFRECEDPGGLSQHHHRHRINDTFIVAFCYSVHHQIIDMNFHGGDQGQEEIVSVSTILMTINEF